MPRVFALIQSENLISGGSVIVNVSGSGSVDTDQVLNVSTKPGVTLTNVLDLLSSGGISVVKFSGVGPHLLVGTGSGTTVIALVDTTAGPTSVQLPTVVDGEIFEVWNAGPNDITVSGTNINGSPIVPGSYLANKTFIADSTFMGGGYFVG